MRKDFLRTAIFKSSEKSVLLLKIRLPDLTGEEYGSELSCAVNSFYRELCKRYVHSAQEAVRTAGDKLIGIYPSPLTLSVSFEPYGMQKSGDGAELKRRQKRRKPRGDPDSCIGFLRTEKLYSREGIIASREIIDLFDKNRGFLLK